MGIDQYQYQKYLKLQVPDKIPKNLVSFQSETYLKAIFEDFYITQYFAVIR